MSDPTESTPEPPTGTGVALDKTKVLELDFKLAALFAYLPVCAINLIFSIIWLATEPRSNHFLRFHAMQSLMLIGALFAASMALFFASIIFAFIPVLGGVLAVINGLIWWGVIAIYIVANIIGMVQAHKGVLYKFPLLGDLTEQYLPK